MKPRFGAFVVLVLASCCDLASAQEHRIEISWSDPELLERKLPLADRLAAEEEVIRIYLEIGIAASFLVDPPAAEENDRPPAFHVVLVARTGEGFRVSGQAMGAILEKNPATRTVFVFLPVILRLMEDPVGNERRLVHDARKGRVLARAVGRVVAHEVAHAIDPDMPHGPPESLMSEHLTSPMLRRYRIGFDEATAERLREGLARFRRPRSSFDVKSGFIHIGAEEGST